jgi:hypothetical protein
LEITLVGDLDEREAGVLLVVGAEPAVVGTAEARGGVEVGGHLAGLQGGAGELVVRDVGRDEDAFRAVIGAVFVEEDLVVLIDDLGLDLAEAF